MLHGVLQFLNKADVLKTQAFNQATCFEKTFSKQSCRTLDIHRNFWTYLSEWNACYRALEILITQHILDGMFFGEEGFLFYLFSIPGCQNGYDVSDIHANWIALCSSCWFYIVPSSVLGSSQESLCHRTSVLGIQSHCPVISAQSSWDGSVKHRKIVSVEEMIFWKFLKNVMENRKGV